jgi:hypothetical protein
MPKKRNHLPGVLTLIVLVTCVAFQLGAQEKSKTKTETFDRDPGWEGINNRSARKLEPATIKQDFGFSPGTHHAGGKKPGEIGGHIEQAGEVAFYGKKIQTKTLDEPMSASGTFACPDGGYHVLIGFFNSDTTNEWRTPNTLGLRLQGRGNYFIAFADYCTSHWLAGGQSFTQDADKTSSRAKATDFPSGMKPVKWSIEYDPNGNDGKGVIRATVGEHTAICDLAPGHKADGATFNHFGIMNVMKSADKGGDVWFDDITIDGREEGFDRDPKWEGKNNRKTWKSVIVRPRFDFGFSPTNFAGGKKKGELGGMIFRGDCRYPEKMACYGDRIGPLTLDKPFKASGKIAMTRGVTDSTALFGFYNSKDSMRQNPSQSDGVPESVVGVHIEGPSSEGFLFYPVYRTKGGGSRAPETRKFQHIHPDGKSHDWSLEYNPDGAGGNGQITVIFDGKSNTFDLEKGDKERGTKLDRFGIVTSWIDGNSENVYWDDVTYTVSQ